MLYKEQMASQMICQQSVQPQLSLNAITEFCDLVPLQQFGEEGEDLVQGENEKYVKVVIKYRDIFSIIFHVFFCGFPLQLNVTQKNFT